jgi:hypothetical protein
LNVERQGEVTDVTALLQHKALKRPAEAEKENKEEKIKLAKIEE